MGECSEKRRGFWSGELDELEYFDEGSAARRRGVGVSGGLAEGVKTSAGKTW